MECAKCKRNNVTLKRCTGCYTVSYCSKACQTADWLDHRKVCKTMTFSPEVKVKTKERNKGKDEDEEGIIPVQAEYTENTERNNKDETKPHSTEQASSQKVEENEQNKTVCIVCRKDAEKKCSRCKIVYYCSKQCQKSDWKSHKDTCQRPESERPFQSPLLNPWFSPFSPFHPFFLGENLSFTATTTAEIYDRVIRKAEIRFPLQNVVSTLQEIPSENFFFRPQTNDLLLAFTPRYHHYRARHCIYIQDKQGEEIYVAFYLDYDNPFPFFSWSDVRPGRFIAIYNPCIHYFMDGSVGLRIEEPSEITFIDV